MDIALFRYAIIAPLAANLGTGQSKEAFYREASEKNYTMPNRKEPIQFTAATFKSWYLKYQKNGLQGLKPKQRIDLGKSRAITPEIGERILAIKEKFPRITGQKIWETLIAEGTIKPTTLSVDTVQRFLKSINLNGSPGPSKERLAFEFEHVNECWQTDTVNGPEITDLQGNVHKTYLISIHDDHSRKNIKGHFYYADNAVNMQRTFKKAVQVGGVPKILVMDNGGSYKNRQFMEICAEIGVGAVYLRPYAPQGKGKEERSHRTMLMRFLDCTDFSGCHDLESLNTLYESYVNNDYNQAINRMTQSSPNDRFMREYDMLRFVDSAKLDIIFLHRASRCMNSSSSIQFENKLYEVPLEFITRMKSKKEKINFRYDPEDLSQLYIIDEKKYRIRYTLRPVDLVGNSKRHRRDAVDYNVTAREEVID